MKQLSIIMGISFLVLVLGSCGKEKSEKELCEEKGSGWFWSVSSKTCEKSPLEEDSLPLKTEIQKVPQFVPVCFADGFSPDNEAAARKDALCPDNSNLKPACGTVPGSGELKAYCIDSNDLILSEAICSSKGLELKCLQRL